MHAFPDSAEKTFVKLAGMARAAQSGLVDDRLNSAVQLAYDDVRVSGIADESKMKPVMNYYLSLYRLNSIP